jgi:hypothetical protein
MDSMEESNDNVSVASSRGHSPSPPLAPVIFKLDSAPDSFKSLNSSQIADLVKHVTAQIGDIKDARLAPRGDLLIYPHTTDQKEQLLAIAEINGSSITTSLTKAETESRVIIHQVPISLDSNTICQQLSHLGATNATRWQKTDAAGGKTPTETVCLTFGCNPPPSEVKLDYQVFRTKPYIPRPKICYNCWGFNHLAAICTEKKKCRTCAGSHKPEESCASNGHCPSCQKQGHPAGTEDCPIFASRQKTIRVAKEKNISIREAAALLNREKENLSSSKPAANRARNKSRAMNNESKPAGEHQPDPQSSPVHEELAQVRKDLELLKDQVCKLSQVAIQKSEMSSLPELRDITERLSTVESRTEEAVNQSKSFEAKIDHLELTITAQFSAMRSMLEQHRTRGTTPHPAKQGPSGQPAPPSTPAHQPGENRPVSSGTPTKRKSNESVTRSSKPDHSHRSPPTKQIGLHQSATTKTSQLNV